MPNLASILLFCGHKVNTVISGRKAEEHIGDQYLSESNKNNQKQVRLMAPFSPVKWLQTSLV